MRNILEVSARKYPLKASAVSAAETIIGNRIKKVKEAREPYHVLNKEYEKLTEKRATNSN